MFYQRGDSGHPGQLLASCNFQQLSNFQRRELSPYQEGCAGRAGLVFVEVEKDALLADVGVGAGGGHAQREGVARVGDARVLFRPRNPFISDPLWTPQVYGPTS